MGEPQAPAGGGHAPRWYERAVTYKVAAFAMIAVGAVLAWLADPWVVPTFLPFLAAWVLCFFLGLVLSKVVRERAWIRQGRAAALFFVAVIVSYLPLVAYREDVARTLVFPAMAALQGIGTAFGFHAPWLYAGKASHEDIRGIDDLMAAMDREK